MYVYYSISFTSLNVPFAYDSLYCLLPLSCLALPVYFTTPKKSERVMNLGVLVDTLELVPRLGFRLEGWIGDWSSKYCAKYRLPSIVCLSLIVKGRVLSATHAHPSIYIYRSIYTETHH